MSPKKHYSYSKKFLQIVHPDAGFQTKVPVNSNVNSNVKTNINADEDDGLFGSMILSLIAGPAFAAALGDVFGNSLVGLAQHFDFNALINGASQYCKDTDNKHRPEISGSGTYAMGVHKTSCNSFQNLFFDNTADCRFINTYA
jgi:hypothetical protein